MVHTLRPFTELYRANPIFIITMIMTIVIIDYISFLQTYLLLRYTARASSFAELLFLAYCDILLSLSIFLFLFPVTIIFFMLGMMTVDYRLDAAYKADSFGEWTVEQSRDARIVDAARYQRIMDELRAERDPSKKSTTPKMSDEEIKHQDAVAMELREQVAYQDSKIMKLSTDDFGATGSFWLGQTDENLGDTGVVSTAEHDISFTPISVFFRYKGMYW
jgi:hypothetical protein